MPNKSILCVIPARYGSTRLPGKPLITIKGLPLVMWAYNRALTSGVFGKVCVATDDRRVFEAVERHGGVAVMTAADHPSGTDRVCEAARALPQFDYIVNLQGDEPLVPADLLKRLGRGIGRIDDNSLLTCVSYATIEERINPNIVKVVLNRREEALYFSRSPIPFDRDGEAGKVLKHCGIYAFTKRGLEHFCGLPCGELEQREKLEQLRALEHGMKIMCFLFNYNGAGIDTPEDVQKFKSLVEG
jgi:3-deoxy-manno-octulosonate cytidylyltransferase (CMP-KDO synthetase)